MATSSRAGRIGRSHYWIAFAVYIVAVVALVGAAFYFMLQLNLGIAIAALLIVAPLGIYFRVLMMRRCRDIGWPASLPWVIFAVSMGASMFGGLGSLGSAIGSPTGIKWLLIGGLGLPLLISLVDLGFTILIGCMPTKNESGEDYAEIFGEAPQPARPKAFDDSQAGLHHEPRQADAAGGPNYDSFDAAVARALEARRAGGSEPAHKVPRSIDELDEVAAAPTPSAHARAVAGFGRKMV
ncbi:MAG: DUF805 domain-containing protein [Novosphingobium sp.]